MIESVLAFPADTAGIGNQQLTPTSSPDGTKRFELDASIVDWEVLPARSSRPGRTTARGPAPASSSRSATRWRSSYQQLPVGTDIHCHGIAIPFGQEASRRSPRPRRPRRDVHLRVHRHHPALGMYHAHDHGHVAVLNGLFGTLPAATSCPAEAASRGSTSRPT